MTAPASTGSVMFQSIEPRRWNSQVPASPVNRNENKAVAAA